MMDVTATIIACCISTVVSGIVGALVASLVTAAKSKGKQTIEGGKAMQSGMRALLWRELKEIHAQAMEQGGLTTEDRRHLESVYEAYHALGGNGTGTHLFDEAMNTKVLD